VCLCIRVSSRVLQKLSRNYRACMCVCVCVREREFVCLCMCAYLCIRVSSRLWKKSSRNHQEIIKKSSRNYGVKKLSRNYHECIDHACGSIHLCMSVCVCVCVLKYVCVCRCFRVSDLRCRRDKLQRVFPIMCVQKSPVSKEPYIAHKRAIYLRQKSPISIV